MNLTSRILARAWCWCPPTRRTSTNLSFSTSSLAFFSTQTSAFLLTAASPLLTATSSLLTAASPLLTAANMPSAADSRFGLNYKHPHRRLSTNKTPFMIGVAGGTASGKSTVCKTIMSRLAELHVKNLEQVVSISQDSFYRELTEEESVEAMKGQFNFDHPDAFDNELMEKCLDDIMMGKHTKIPVYDFKTNSRVEGQFTVISPSDVVLVEGILIFYYPKMRDVFNLKLFVDADADTRLARRVLRDIEERGRDLEHVLKQYTTLVKPAFEEFCIPTKKYADIIVPRGAENKVAIDLIVQNCQDIIFRGNGGSKSGSPVSSRSRSNSESIIR